jgi:uncharacterized protein (TIGR03546 family)
LVDTSDTTRTIGVEIEDPSMAFSTRKIAEGMYGGHQPRDVAAAVALGILAGAVTGGNLTWAAMLLAAILFNVHTRLFLAAWLASVLLAWLCRGSLETLGRFLLEGTPLDHVLEQLGDGTLIALLGWNEYDLVGGLASGAIAAVVCSAAAYTLTRRLSRRWSYISQATASEPSLPLVRHRRGERPLLVVWYGPSSREQSLRRSMVPRRLRRYGVPTAIAASLGLVIGSWSLARWSIDHDLRHALSRYNGAEVSWSSTQLSLLSGEFVIRDIEVADPAHLDRNRLRIGVAKGMLSPGLLLQGKLDIEKLALAHIRTDIARQQPAQRFPGSDSVASDERTSYDTALPNDAVEISSSLREWPTASRQLAILQRLIVAVEHLSRAEKTDALCGYDRRHRSDLGRPQPCVLVRELRVSDLPSELNLGRKALLQVTHLTSNAALATKPTEVKITVPKFGAELQLAFAVSEGQTSTLCISACDIDLSQVVDLRHLNVLSKVSGVARLLGEGTFDRHRLDLPLRVEVDSLQAEISDGEPLAGVDREIWIRGLKQLTKFNMVLACVGPWSSPCVVAESGSIIEQVERQLRAVGQHELADAMELQFARYEEQRTRPLVVQVSALGTQPPDSPPGMCEFSVADDAEPLPGDEGACQDQTPDVAVENASAAPIQYPTTSMPYDDSEYDSSPPSQPVAPAVAPRRRLPGPVNMVVGRDPYAASRATAADVGAVTFETDPRPSFWSRWTNGLRQKLGQTFSSSEPAIDQSPPPEFDQPPPSEERSIPAAASEAWYNRRWR